MCTPERGNKHHWQHGKLTRLKKQKKTAGDKFMNLFDSSFESPAHTVKSLR